MKSIKLYFYIFILLFSRFSFGEFLLIDGSVLKFKEHGMVSSKIYIDKISDNDTIRIESSNSSDRVDVYDYNSSNASYSVSSIKYDNDKKYFIQERLEYVNNCSYCSDMRTEYCSINKPLVISNINFQEAYNNAICYFTYEDKSKVDGFNNLSELTKAFNSNRQYMKSFSFTDIDEMVNKFGGSDIGEYREIIGLLKCEGEYSLLSHLNEKLSISEGGVVKNKSYLYNNPDGDKTKLYLIKGDVVSILDRRSSNNKDWYLINYKGKKEINMWIKADAVDLN